MAAFRGADKLLERGCGIYCSLPRVVPVSNWMSMSTGIIASAENYTNHVQVTSIGDRAVLSLPYPPSF